MGTYPFLEVAHLLVVVAKVGEQEGLEEWRQRLRSRHCSSRRSDHGHDERALRGVAPVLIFDSVRSFRFISIFDISFSPDPTVEDVPRQMRQDGAAVGVEQCEDLADEWQRLFDPLLRRHRCNRRSRRRVRV